MSLVIATCDKCDTSFKMYKDSIVANFSMDKGKLSDLFFNRYLCATCFFERYKSLLSGKFSNSMVKIAKERYPEFGDDKWLIAHLL